MIELTQINQNIAELNGEAVSTDQFKLPLEYNAAWNWPKKIEYVLREAKKKLSALEIIDQIGRLEGFKPNSLQKNRINVAIQYQVKSGGILSKSHENGKIVIGLKEWDSVERRILRAMNEAKKVNDEIIEIDRD